MAVKSGGAKVADKSKGKKTKKAGRKLSALYTLGGEKAQRKNRFCPKCGPGMFMAIHKDRVVCGKCKYTEFVKR